MRIYRRRIKQRNGRVTPSKVWWCEFRTSDSKQHRVSTKRHDRVAATAWGMDRMKEREQELAGILPTRSKHAERTPLTELVEQYLSDLERRGRAAKHVSGVKRQLGRMAAGFDTVDDLSTQGIRARLGELARGVKQESGAVVKLGGRTIDAHRRALLAFLAWLPDGEEPERDPMRQVGKPKATSDASPRRALTDAELAKLLVAAPPHRRLIYQFAATSGLRRGELSKLRWSDIDLDRATVTVRGKISKNAKTVTLPLPEGTVASLRALGPGDGRLFAHGMPDMKTMRGDLKRAKVKYQTGEGRADFHAFRVRYVTKLVELGLDAKAVQRLARHSTPTLTLDVYAKLRTTVGQEAVAGLDVGVGG